MTAAFQRLMALETWERRLLAAAAILLPTCRLLLLTCGYRRTQRLIGRWCSPLTSRHVPGEQIAAVRRLVAIAAARGRPRATCLPQALTTWFLLRRAGVEAEVHVGVRLIRGRFDGHAWVAVAGAVIDVPARGPVSASTPFLSKVPFRRVL